MNVGVAIQTHPLRYLMACDLARQLGDCVQVYDPRPHEHRSAWRCYRWCLERALIEDWTHVLVLQDDAKLCRDFNLLLPRVVDAQPEVMIALFCAAVPIQAAKAIEQAVWHEKPFALLDPTDWVPVVATIWPTSMIERALAWVDEQRWKPDFTADDEIAGRVARALGVPVLATAPSLVEHPDEVESIAGARKPFAGRDKNRVAHRFAGDADLTGVDWTAGFWTRF